MDKVQSVHTAADNSASEYPLRGILRARTYVAVTDLFGNTRKRCLSIGMVHSINAAEAIEMVQEARERNESPVLATLTFNL